MLLTMIITNKFKNALKSLIFFVKCKVKKILRKMWNINSSETSYSLAILCVKNVAYCELSINNVNSLHYLNPNYNFIFYCDHLCFDYFKKAMSRFSYPKMVQMKEVFGGGELPWQKYKIETLIDAFKNDYILTDADGIWHEEPVVVPDKINILTVAYKIGDNIEESILVKKLFGREDWLKFNHYVTGFVYVPAKLMTVKLISDLRNFVVAILDSQLEFIDKEKRLGIKRLSEELAINFALQSNYPGDQIVVLKEKDGPGSKNKLQSLYYGCINNINI